MTRPARLTALRAAAFFDLDKTIIAKSSTLAFGRPFYTSGLIDRRAALKSAYAQFVFSLSGADETQMNRMRDAIAALCAGWDVSQVRRIVDETLHDLIDPIVYAEAVDLIARHRAAGRDVVIVSSSGVEVVAPIGALLGVEDVIATEMEIVDGHYTGNIAFYAYGPHKAVAIRDLANRRGYELTGCYAYSDSITDLPMLDAVGHPTAVNPDRALRKLATRRDWPVSDFRNPVRLRDRLPHPPRTLTAGAAVGAAAGAAVGTAWLLRRGRRSAR
ncbi:MAG TPA: HAD-IB family hydrolase [Mycobacteriales bacterium]|nr:HAD-IB family hydrolase [Mycobacteriales bacterium]